MTAPGYGLPVRPASWRYVLTALAALLGPPAGAVAGFAAVVTWSGCFLTCTSPDRLVGGLLGALALALLWAGPVTAVVLLRNGWAVLATIAAPVVLGLPLWHG